MTKRAFTLVELLVVVTIIVILLALLAPAMDTAMELTRRTICASRLDAFGHTHVQYALDNRRRLVPGWAATGHPGSFQNAIWSYNEGVSIPTMGKYREMGHLAKIGYQQNARDSLYCPDTPRNLFGHPNRNQTAWPEDGEPENHDQYNTGYIQYSYNYRTTLDATGTLGPFRPARLGDSGSITIHVDYFTWQVSQRTHLDGYSVSKLDGSVTFVYDHPDIYKGIRYAFGVNGMDGGGDGCYNQELAYQKFFDRPFDGRYQEAVYP